MKKFLTALLVLLTVAGALSLSFAMPSGILTDEAQEAYMEAQAGDDDFFDPDLFLKNTVSCGMSGGGVPDDFEDFAPEGTYELPWDTSEGMTLNPDGFTENGYRDDSVVVEVYNDFVNDSIVHVAYIKVASPTQLRTKVAGSTQYTSVMAKKVNAVVAINGDYYTDRDGGVIVRQGKSARQQKNSSKDSLLIDKNGDFHIVKAGDSKGLAEAMKCEAGIANAFYFGPAYIIDGEIQPTPAKYAFQMDSAQPRTAIGQVGPLTYVFVTVEGRQSGRSEGMDYDQMAAYMAELGCIQAFNLDGGNSSTFAFNGTVYRGQNAKERDVKDIIYIASAVDPAAWQ